jgi:uncharacterized repeat protein (TIGR01451 family)
MRRTLWILSAPVIAGGLAWSVNAIQHQNSLMAGPPQGQNGKIIYFSRSGKPAAAPQPKDADDADDTATTAASDDAASAAANDSADQSAAPRRYVRNRPTTAAKATAGSNVKNYRELFADSETPSASSNAKTAIPQGTPRRPMPDAAAPATSKLLASDDSIASDASDADAASDDMQSSSAGETQLVDGVREAGAVRQAEMRSRGGSTRNNVRTVQHTQKQSPAKSNTAPATPPDDDDESAAPVPPPANVAKPAKSQKEKEPAPKTTAGSAKPTRSPSDAKASQQAAKPVRKPIAVAVSKAKPAVVHAAADDSAPAAAASGVTFAAATSDDVPMVSLRWSKINEVNVNQECKCGLLVKNTGKMVAKDIVVEAFFPRSVRLIDAEPFPNDSKDHLVWIFEHLDPGQEKAIEITMIPGRRGELAANATVRFTGLATSIMQVEEPQLGLVISGPHEAMVGETLTQIITVSNSGTGIAHDVVVHAKVPEGLEHPRGKVVEMGIGSLGAGETRELRLPLAAVAGGEGTLLVEARGGGNLSQNAQTSLKIAAPKLGIELAGPGLRYVGRHAVYMSTVTNEGVAATDNVRIVHLIPEGFEFKKADKGGKFDAATGSVSWFIGRVEAAESVQVACELDSKQSGEYLHLAQVSGESGTSASAKVTTRVESSSKVTMEVADLDDPVEVGAQTAYEIRIRNDGTKAAQSLKIVCELPVGVELIDTTGPTAHFVEKGLVHFKPLPELGAGAKATYVIRVNGVQAGNLRMRAKLTSSASPEPVVVEEVTKFYAD